MAIRVGKVTVSLPKDDLKKVNEYETKLHVPRSVLFKQAVELWLEVKEREEIMAKYISVYSNSRVRKRQLGRVEKMLPVALEVWPILKGWQ